MDNPNDNIAAIKKDIKRIRRSGSNTRIFGWVLLALAPAALWLISSKMLVLAVFGVSALLGVIFIMSGKYIRDGTGKKVKLLLLLNGCLSLLISWLILPLFICIQSFNNYSRFKALPEKIQELYCRRKRFNFGIVNLILVVVVLLVGIASVWFKLKDINKQTSAAISATNATIQSAPKANTAKYLFMIDFPSQANQTDFTKKVNGKDVPYSSYVSTAANSTQNFIVYAYKYPDSFKYATMSKANLAKAIHTSLGSIVKDLHGTIATSIPSTFSGYQSEDAVFTSQTLAGTTTGYIRVFYIGNYEYGIFSIGSSQADFNNFANSFKQYTN